MSRIRRRMPVVMPLFHSSLERAVGTAEAMEARGFGAAGRTQWRRRAWDAGGLGGLAAALAIVVVSLYLALWGDGRPVFYPRIELVAGPATLAWQLVMTALVSAPAFLAKRGGGRDG